MVNFNFTEGPSYYTYGAGVNAANLTSENIRDANAKLDPFRQRRIRDGLLKPTMGDPTYGVLNPAAAKPIYDYVKWTRKELSEALVARQIKTDASVKKINKAATIATLEKADQHPRFARFLELSAELRNDIYALAMEDSSGKKKSRVCPVTPAVSRVNRQLRSETLPLFFRKVCMSIIVTSEPTMFSPPQPQQLHSSRQPAAISESYWKYFKHAENAGWLQHMRRFHWCLMHQTLDRDGMVDKRWYERYFVEFSGTMQIVRTWTDDADKAGRLEQVQANMTAITNGEIKDMTGEAFYTMMAFFTACVEERFT